MSTKMGSRTLLRLSVIISLILMFSCENPREPLMNDFNALHKVVIAGDLDRYIDFLDTQSKEFVTELSNKDNMKAGVLSKIGERFNLTLWCAEYFKYHSNHVIKNPDPSTFFSYLAMSQTPLFDYASDFELIEDKVKIGEENFIALAKHSGKYRYVNWLEYTHEETSYKLNLLYLLKLEEGRSWNIEKTNASYIHGEKLPAGWREEAVALYYKTAKVHRPITIEDFDKRIRPEKENGN